MPIPRPRFRPRISRSLRCEPLEVRLPLHGDEVLTGADMHLTLSFAADGVAVAGASNVLHEAFARLGTVEQWQSTILRAFQTWAVETNADIGVVPDEGGAFGAPGLSQRDPRFGDIRIAAIPLEPTVGAVSVPTDRLVAGTWFADVAFNSNFDFRSLDDLYAVALHEAGNVFGLPDNQDPNSPLSPSDPPAVRTPTADDVADLRALHGARMGDPFETAGHSSFADNDVPARAAPLAWNKFDRGPAGSAPTLVYGDVAPAGDVDYYLLQTPPDYVGAWTATVRSDGVSLLAPRLRVLDANLQLLGESHDIALGGGRAVVSIDAVTPGSTYYLEVSAAEDTFFQQGGYALTAVFDDVNVVDQQTLEQASNGALRFVEADDLAEWLGGDTDELYGNDWHADDEPQQAVELESVPGFADDTRYRIVASIADVQDKDYYLFDAPEEADPSFRIMTVTIRSLDAGRLVPAIGDARAEGLALTGAVLSNGGGELIVQYVDVPADKDVLLSVQAADPMGLFGTGNYEFSVAFGGAPVQLVPLGIGEVGSESDPPTHVLHVGEPQLFHFVLTSSPSTEPDAGRRAVVARFVDAQGNDAYQLTARPGETRSREAVLLAPGTYQVVMAVVSLDDAPAQPLAYSIAGMPLSDPFVADPNDPTANPFACADPALAGLFCYPGDPDPVVSADPFLWEEFLASQPAPAKTWSTQELVSVLFGDWWNWVWNALASDDPPTLNGDAYQVATDAAFSAGPVYGSPPAVPAGVLANDVIASPGNVVVALVEQVAHGQLVFAADGSFAYTPAPGFSGIDQFTYTAFDFGRQATPATVRLVVGVSADFDASGLIDGFDLLTWQRGFGASSEASLATGDGDFSGTVDHEDLAMWEQTFNSASVQAAAISAPPAPLPLQPAAEPTSLATQSPAFPPTADFPSPLATRPIREAYRPSPAPVAPGTPPRPAESLARLLARSEERPARRVQFKGFATPAGVDQAFAEWPDGNRSS